ncbi:TonB-dependent receptor plug domain-containing protein [Gilvimarinus sp. 1_MG-2023]|uniref:TonB-dependent receptor plug domain-containing protein n=1 Tax=Gilvimarinus sp. 1_MG-2023 TaxID=3062638 RepID=UPI0026E2B9F4|nr:TonB-dependent receptor [Gilvimarinus sp. 1_MG-2023]MDO6747593.1 TonB-dependent receptor [Gilvimarinus sp. 1_MG-2023]
MQRNARLFPLICSTVFFPFCSTSALAQSVADEPRIEEVLILGSRTVGRTLDDMPVPVDVFTPETLARTGQSELGRMLQAVAPSFNFSSSSVSDGTDALRPATLRGLGPDQTLVLINGKRRHQASLVHINTSVGRGTAGTDINAIPPAAIGRIEVLRDGAAAQYGSDAIAGIINIVLKDASEGGSVSGSVGQTAEGDGETVNLDVNKGLALGSDGFVNFTANFRDRAYTNRADPQGGCLYGGCVDTDGNGYLEPADEFSQQEVNGPARDGFRIGDADSTQYTIAVNAGLDLGPGELYGFVTYSGRDNQSGAFYRNPTGTNDVDNALLSDGLNPVDPDGFLPIIGSVINDVSASMGYALDLTAHTHLDVAYTYGENTIDYTTENSGNYSYANYLRYGQGLSDAEVRAQMPRQADAYGLALDLQTLNINLTQSLGDINLAYGAEWRRDGYAITAGERYAWDDYDTDPNTGAALYAQDAGGAIQGFNGIAPASAVNESRQVVSLFVDGEYQVTDNWLVSAAVRWDDYDGFGDTFNYKLASNFHITEQLTVRGAYSTGFRAPSMQQLYFNNISTQIRDDGAVTVGTFRNDSDVVRALGVPELVEEQSENISLGLVAQFNDQFSVTVDVYSIDIADRIGISNQLTADNDPGDGLLQTALTEANVAAAQFFLNGADTETRGVDVVATYTDVELLDGNLDITFAANYTDTEVTSTYVPQSGAIASLDPSVVFSSQDISIVESWQPEDRLALTGDYHRGDFSATLSFNRYGEYTVVDSSPQTYSAETLTDLRLGYDLTDQLELYFSGNNIFDVTPDEVTNTNSRGGLFESTAGAEDMASDTVFRYSRRSAPFGFNGAFYSLGVNYRF